FLLMPIAAAADLGLIIVTAFHLKLATALDSLRFMGEIDPAASLFYMAVVAVMLVTALLAAWLIERFRGRLRGASPTPAAAAALLLMLLDWNANFPFIESTNPDLPFESAVGASGLDAEAVAARGNNVLIVLVEGMGAFASAEDRDRISAPLRAAAARHGYRFESGTSAYSGSTTGAESRELCGRWGDYQDYLPERAYDCLPRRLANRGYETIAYHGYMAAMFDRGRWFPHIGFTRLNFQEEIERDHGALVPSRCGSVFHGLCDEEVAELVRRELVAPAARPKLVYWLTLNSHVPFVPRANPALACDSAAPPFGNRTVCQLGDYWLDVVQRVARIAADPALPPTDILIVGDHHTPLWERAAKNRFVLNRVDWFLLRAPRARGDRN
ncbi:MAG TPA: sulfatase-like hydrolase/transferase, partial [Allosphingosinicella sp.]|nr:sulfatase-like hydrolase/transferase [Allosphingosinicella sp.]